MRKLILIGLMLIGLRASSQVLVTIQLPPNGVVQKTQLWNLVLTSQSTGPKQVHIEMMMSDVQTGQQVMSGTTRIFTLPPGMLQGNSILFGPIQYNSLSAAYYVDPGPAGLLPVGQFSVCYTVMEHVNDAVNRLNEECIEVIIEPLAPPMLQFPEDAAKLNSALPMFTWLPPMPSFLFTDLRYDLEVVEVFPNQSAADAVQQNIPFFRQSNISGNTFGYPMSAPVLLKDKQYAWRVIAKSMGSLVGASQVWMFSWGDTPGDQSNHNGNVPYVKMTKDFQVNTAIFFDAVKFEYVNETTDTLWNISITDLTTPNRITTTFPMQGISLRRGQNLVEWNPSIQKLSLLDKHSYLLELVNSRQETWRIRFDYRKQN